MTLPSPAPINIKFNRLLVLSEAERRRKPSGATIRFMLCVCDCGVQKEIRLEKLRNGESGSCGCLQKEMAIKYSTTHGQARKLFKNRSKEYSAWAHIKQRCLNPNATSFSDYGGRGITICEQWKNSFEQFFLDVGAAPEKNSGISIDRIDNNRGYEPGNVRWADRSTQNKNRRPRNAT